MKPRSYRGNGENARTKATNSMEMINPNTAGIDVGSEERWVCVPSGRVNIH